MLVCACHLLNLIGEERVITVQQLYYIYVYIYCYAVYSDHLSLNSDVGDCVKLSIGTVLQLHVGNAMH